MHSVCINSPIPSPAYKTSSIADVPALANTPGLSFPSNIPLKPYARANKNNASGTGKSLLSKSEHLLHTSVHPKIDYIGREEEGSGTDVLHNHYIGVYDPQSGQMQLVRARKLVLRSSVRLDPFTVKRDVEPPNVS